MKGQALSDLEAVIAIARRGSFRGAARDLEVSPAALSHAIATLEERLGVRLFHRTTRSVSLTSAGDAFVAEITPALGAIRGAFEQISRHRDTPTGLLRVNSSSIAAHQSVLPIVLECLRRFPEMKVDLVVDDRLVDIVAEGFDAGVRLDTVPADMIAIPVGEEQHLAVVAAPEYLAAHKAPQTPGDLLDHECIRIRLPSGAPLKWGFKRDGKRFDVDVPGRLTLDRAELMLDAASAGLGIAYVWRSLAASDLASRKLVEVLRLWTPAYGTHSLYYPSRKYAPAGLRAFLELARQAGRRKRP
jgi:DNA-binding transcriptional LysR family regulator